MFLIEQYAVDEQKLSVLVGYFAALLALAGWMVQAYLSVRISRKQHSINILFQTRMSEEYQRNLENVNKHFPGGTTIFLAEINSHEKRDLYSSVVFLLNYYEFISVGIGHGDLDESIIRDYIKSQFLSFAKRAEELIAYARKEDENGIAQYDCRHTYAALRRIQFRWKKYNWLSLGTWPFVAYTQ